MPVAVVGTRPGKAVPTRTSEQGHLTSSNGPSAPDDDEVLADHPFLKAALATGDSAEIKRAIEVETAREAILRIAHERPELRPQIYEMVKETSEELQARLSARA